MASRLQGRPHDTAGQQQVCFKGKSRGRRRPTENCQANRSMRISISLLFIVKAKLSKGVSKALSPGGGFFEPISRYLLRRVPPQSTQPILDCKPASIDAPASSTSCSLPGRTTKSLAVVSWWLGTYTCAISCMFVQVSKYIYLLCVRARHTRTHTIHQLTFYSVCAESWHKQLGT